jgi:hypothetical protein
VLTGWIDNGAQLASDFLPNQGYETTGGFWKVSILLVNIIIKTLEVSGMKFRGLVLLFLVFVTIISFALKIIYLVGNGMSFNQLLLASILEGRVLTTMTLPYTGITTTYSADSWVTDSAPAGTALFGGYKTLNRAIGVLPNGTPMPSIFEIAKRTG